MSEAINTEILVKALQRRNFGVVQLETAAEAAGWLLSVMLPGESVAWGGSATVNATGIKEMLADHGMVILNRDTVKTADEKRQVEVASFGCDHYLMSTSALTQDGLLINIDGAGNRLAALMYGPRNVYVLVGVNKLCGTEAEGLHRVRNLSAPANARRLNRNTPCAVSGTCHNCLTTDCVCSHIVVTRRSWTKERITVILINEALGL
jgi:hypothetical protein